MPDQEWGCGLQFPIGAAAVAAGGFVVAAMWIDTIATELVAIIEYLGLLSGINHTVGASSFLDHPYILWPAAKPRLGSGACAFCCSDLRCSRKQKYVQAFMCSCSAAVGSK